MYPLLELGPLRVSSGGLFLLAGAYLWLWLVEREARRIGGDGLAAHASACALPAVLGALVGARLWYGLFNLDQYGQTPGLLLALSIADLAWPGALLGGALSGWAWARRRGADWPALADGAALALPLPLALASIGMLLSGAAFGVPTTLPWGVALLGTTRQPTQIAYAVAAGIAWGLLRRVVGAPPGGLAARFLVLNGLSMILIEPLRADSLTLIGGIRVNQLFGLGLVLGGLWVLWRPCVPSGASE